MRSVDYLIIGNGIAGLTAAETIREADVSSSIVIVTNEAHLLYSRVLLPNYAKGLIPRERVFLRTQEQYDAKKIELVRDVAATGLDVGARSVSCSNGDTFQFGKLLISSGGKPRSLLGAPGDVRGVSRFQTIDDTDQMLSMLAEAKKGLVVGGSFIALEYLEILFRHKVPTSLLFSGEHFLGDHMDEAGSTLLEDNFRAHGIDSIFAGDQLKEIIADAAVQGVKTVSDREIECDFLGLGIGIERSTEWLRSSTVELSKRGVLANEFLETNIEGVFAAGDVADFFDVSSQIHLNHGNWNNAFLQGRQAGWNMAHAGEQKPFKSVPFYSIVNLGMNIGFVGRTRSEGVVERFVRSLPQEKRYACFLLMNKKMIGAVLINYAVEKPAVAALIERAQELAGHEDKLRDSAFPLASLIRG